MRPGDRHELPTVEQAVREAAHACDPEGRSDGVRAFVESFEDDDRPATAAEDLRGELAATAEQIDPDVVDPPVALTAATAHWLATDPGAAERPEQAIREGVRLFFQGDPPAPVAELVDERA